MDESAQQLFQQLGGVSAPESQKPSAQPKEAQTGVLPDQDNQLDRWRMLLVESAYLLNSSLRDAHYWEGFKAEKDTFRQFMRIILELDQKPGNDRTIRINLRGSQAGKVAEKIDYTITFGDVSVDAATITNLTNRLGLRVKHLEGRLLKSFECFSDQGIGSLILYIPDSSDHSLEMMRIALRVISCYNQALDNNSAIEFVKDGEKYFLLPIHDEMNQPDLNLTLVAALNGLSSETMRELIQKVTQVIKREKVALAGDQPANVYRTMFRIKSLQQRLVKPPIEVNSDKSSAAQVGQRAASGGHAGLHSGVTGGTGQSSGAAGTSQGIGQPLDSGIVKARVAQFVKETFSSSPENAKQIMKSVFGRDYNQITQENLGERLVLINDLLRATEQSTDGQQLMQEILRRIQGGMDQVPPEVFDDVVLNDDEVKFWSEKGETVVSKVDKNLLNVIDISKQRSATKKKMRTVLNPTADFGTPQYEAIAKDFGISVQDAENIINLFMSCFDAQGNFLRVTFEKNIVEFSRYQKKVFEILWEFLKETPRRNDRLPFLNSIQLLINEAKNPIQAIRVLLADFIVDPTNVAYPDRNAMMLSNQFLRTYNKEVNMDIEITPEEVLLVKEGLNTDVVNYAKWKVDGEQKTFFEKIVTIRKKLLEALDPDNSVTQLLPVRFLLALEREVHIFLSLIGGTTAYTVIQGALNVYGNPASQVYLLKESQNHLTALLQHLAALIRGFGRIGEKKDLSLLDEIKAKQAEFISLGEDTRHEALVRRVIGWIDDAKKNIGARWD
ncbi:MAG: hypothetical protein JSV31_29865 [Desulfobacterales bacterium]|nr:MAG: hypothetical protein JSV31_29865 [Desulfobacterales bacterium]